MNFNREASGRYMAKLGTRIINWTKKWLIRSAVVCALGWFGFGMYLYGSQHKELVAYADSVPQKEELKGLTVEQLEDKLDAIIWHLEGGKEVMEDGDIFPTFDPSSKMYAQCIKIGGKQPKDCLSYGPRQEKIGTIQNYWPKLHNGEKLTDRAARDIAESNQESKRFFLDCAVQIKGCVTNWTTATDENGNVKTEIQLYIDLIREAKGITL